MMFVRLPSEVRVLGLCSTYCNVNLGLKLQQLDSTLDNKTNIRFNKANYVQRCIQLRAMQISEQNKHTTLSSIAKQSQLPINSSVKLSDSTVHQVIPQLVKSDITQ